MSHPDDMTVNDLIEVLSQLPDEVRTYTVWLEADPSTPLSKDDRPEINHEQRRILLAVSKAMSIEEQLRRADAAIAAGNTRSAEEFIAEMEDDAVSALKIMCWLNDRLTHSDEIASDQFLDWERRTAAQGEAYAFALAYEFVQGLVASR